MNRDRIAGLSRQRLARIDRFIQERYVDAGRFPGALVLVARHGEVAHLGLIGQADVERGAPVREGAIFRIYSMTKPITSVAMMILVEEGKAALDDPVEKFIPAFRDLGVFVAGQPGAWVTRRPARPMQIVDLLRHTSGLTYGLQRRTSVDAAYREAGIGELAPKLALEEMVAALGRIPLDFSPGEAWNYSVSTDVLGYLVQVVSGQPFAEFLRSRLFDPLEMYDTDFHVPAQKAARLAACYSFKQGGGFTLQDDPAKSPYLSPPVFYSGGGGLVSTAADYLKFCRMLLAGGQSPGGRILSRKTLSFMTQNHLPGGKDLTELSRSIFSEAAYAGVGFGLGFATTFDPVKCLIASSPGEFYWGGAASTAFWVDPAEDLAVIFMTQLLPSSTYPIRRELRTLVYAAFDD
jgi:CubicO group peptidase (beta-lactamase class C family)